jgi:hypothetical protein
MRRRMVGARRKRRVVRRRIGLGALRSMMSMLRGRRMRPLGAGRRRRRVGGRRVHRRRMGGSAFTDFFTKTIPGAARSVYEHVLKPAHGFIKKHGLVSKGLELLGPEGKAAGTAARALGYGRRRRRVAGGRRRRRVGGVGGVTRLVGYGRRRRMGGAAMTGRLYIN